jgi:hypothetical protein
MKFIIIIIGVIILVGCGTQKSNCDAYGSDKIDLNKNEEIQDTKI